jgi:DNA-binding beta-propeller fold protein YncE
MAVPARRGALVAAAALVLAACGEDADEPDAQRGDQGAGTAQPYPPRAAEPRAAPPATETPAGRVVRVGAEPEGVAVDPDSGVVALAVEDPGRLLLLDGETGKTVRTVALPGTARHVELARPGGPFLVPLETADRIAEVPVDGGEIRTTRVGSFPHDAAYLDGSIFTADEYGSTLSEVRDGRLVRQVPVDAQPGGVTAVGDALAVTAVRAYTVELFDREDLVGQGAQSAGLGPSHVVADPGGRLYIADTRGRQLIVYETLPRKKWIARVPLDGTPLGLAVDPKRGRLWVTLTERNEVAEVRLGDRPGIIRRLPTARQPDSVGVNTQTGRAYVAARKAGTLQIIDP